MLLPASDASAADWLVERTTTFAGSVASLVPSGFQAYARVFHPAGGRSWHEVAADAGTVAHPTMQWEALTGWDYYASHVPGLFGARPEQGSLPRELVRPIATLLERHTASTRWWYAIWHGFGGGYHEAVAGAPTFGLPGREYHLLSGGPADAATSLQAPPWWQSANLWWPDDRAWCVASEIDLVSTYVGGPRALVDELVAVPGIEAAVVQPSDGVALDSDGVNV